MAEARTDYPALLASLSPDQAANIFNDRVALIKKINADLADWLQERRKVEEAYVIGLRKLASRPQQDAGAALGIFQTPWQRIVAGTENLAASHETLAHKIEADVESPLRQFTSKNAEMKAVTSTQGNLTSMAKELTGAQKKAEKASAKGRDAGSAGVEEAVRQWESQAPYMFEQLQALDEKRVNHLRDVLTQLQTHEVDQVERTRASAESCLNALLSLETADEIRTFAAKIHSEPTPRLRRLSSATAATTTTRPGTSTTFLAPPEPPPPRLTQGRSSQNDSSLREPSPSKSRFGLKRLSTVVGRRKSNAPPPPPVHGDKKKDRKSFAPFRRGESSRSFQDLENTGRDLTPVLSADDPGGLSQIQSGGTESPRNQLGSSQSAEPAAPLVNGTSLPPSQAPPSRESTQPPTAIMMDSTTPQQQQYTAPPLAPQELPAQASPIVPQTTGASESEENARNFAIRDKPIQEDATEAQAAMSSMANQLRLQAPMARPQGSLRGRRDVRNTMFVPSGMDPATAMSSDTPPVQTNAPPATNAAAPVDMASPIQRTALPRTILEDHTLGSDTQSVHSSHSLATQTHHQDLHDPGLNASIIETVNTWFTEAGVSKSVVTGEIAFACNPSSLPSTILHSEHETIRLTHFELLEKVAANPVYVTDMSKQPSVTNAEEAAGTYSLALQPIRRPTPMVGLKYQLHLEPQDLAAYSPLLLVPAWQLIEGQASVILLYKLNPVFASSSDTEPAELTLKNVLISISLDTSADAPKPTSAMMKPTTSAAFRRKASAVTWKYPELVVKQAEERMLVRFTTAPGVPRKGAVEVKFEVQGRAGSTVGVQRGVLDSKEKDPFADGEEDGGEGGVRWEAVACRRGLVSGRYSAS